MNETSKAMRRRFIEHTTGGFQWLDLFRGRGLDVGCGPDKVPFPKCEPFDQEQGDANDLTKYFERGALSYLHASQCLEHMDDPETALESWIAVVKPRGALIITVPDFVLYEGLRWPSQWNPDHKSTWSLSLRGSPAPQHIYVPDFLGRFTGVSVLRAELIDTRYDYKLIGADVDQTFDESRGVEAFIEVVLRVNAGKK